MAYEQPHYDPSRRVPPHRPDPVALVWVGGAVLALLAYLVGPGHVIASALAALGQFSGVLAGLIHNLTVTAFDLLRAVSIGLFGTFLALSLLAIGRTQRGKLALVFVSLGFLILVWDADGTGYGDRTRWLMALLLAGLSALSVTRRLRGPLPRAWAPPGPRTSAVPPP